MDPGAPGDDSDPRSMDEGCGAELDAALVRGLKKREPAALKDAYDQNGAHVQRLCLRLLGRAADAEDAAQEVFLGLFERVARFDGRARFSTWLHRVTVNHCLHRLEKERLRRTRPLPSDGAMLLDPSDSPEEALGRTEARLGLARLLARLSDEHRSILVLRELEGLSYQEIATALAIPPGTVMSRLARAREQLLLHATREGASREGTARDGARPETRDDAAPAPAPLFRMP